MFLNTFRLIILVFNLKIIFTPVSAAEASRFETGDIISMTVFEQAKKLTQKYDSSDTTFAKSYLNLLIRCEVISRIAFKANLRGEEIFRQDLKGYLGGKPPSYWFNLSDVISKDVPKYSRLTDMSFETAWKYYENEKIKYFEAYITYINASNLVDKLDFLEHDLETCARLVEFD